MALSSRSGVTDADIIADAASAAPASAVDYSSSNAHAIMDGDLPEFVRAFLVCHTLSAVDQTVLTEAGIMPKLYASYNGRRVRVTMASRLGDVGVSYDDKKAYGYSDRVSIYDLTDFDVQWDPEAPALRRSPVRRYALCNKDGEWVRVSRGTNSVSPIAKTQVPHLYETRKAAYRDHYDIDPYGLIGLQVVPVGVTRLKDS